MLRLTTYAIFIFSVFLTLPATASAATEATPGADSAVKNASDRSAVKTGPPAPAQKNSPGRLSVAAGLSGLSDEQIERVYRMQKAGYILLGTGFGISLASIIVIEAFQWGPGAWAGFIGVGVGIAAVVTGMFLLGFSRPVHGYRKKSHLGFSPMALKGGGALSLGGTFY